MNDLAWDVFYDETNNYRKVFLSNGRLNITFDSNFVLAGIATKESKDSIVWNNFYKKIGIHNNISELKAKNAFRGDFLTCLSSQRLNNFLHLLAGMDIYVHFLNLNILYWAIIDIVESLLSIRNTPNLLQRRASSVLLDVVRIDKNNFIKILSSFGYPDVKDREDFVKTISDLIKKNIREIDRSNSISDIDICGICCACDVFNNEKLEFIEDGKCGIIFDDFLSMYLHIPMKFPQSTHFFDAEDNIQELLEQQKIIWAGIAERIFFVNSKDDIRIQISDVISGFLGKYFTFISNSSIKDLLTFSKNLSPIQVNSLNMLCVLLERTDDFNAELSMRIESLHNCEKSDLFLLSHKT